MKSVKALLQPVYGYIELGMFAEAVEELDSLPSALQHAEEVSLARLELLVETKQWCQGALMASELCRSLPQCGVFWIKWAYCLHELGRTAEARNVILGAPSETQKEPILLYNLACYESQLNNITQAKKLLSQAIAVDRSYQTIALDDPDLAPIWKSLQTTPRRSGQGD